MPNADHASQPPMIQRVADVDLPALDVYRHLKDKDLKCREGLFIAEGLEVVRRLLQSEYAVHSLLVTPGKLDRLRNDLRSGVPVYVADVEQMQTIAGFTIHRGALACGVRAQPMTVASAIDMVQTRANDGSQAGRALVVGLEGVCDAQNVGVVIRNAAAFGADLIVLSGCCDPFYRRAIRVSMGNVFRLPLLITDNLVGALGQLKHSLRLTLVAAELSQQAQSLYEAAPRERPALLFGAEGHGLSSTVLDVCDLRLRIPMPPETDSVNIAVASGIFLFALSAKNA